MKKDILWINYLKAICIIGVFFVHCNQYYGLEAGVINAFIHPFYVNAFFFISGYLFFRKQLSDNLIKKNVREYLQYDGKSLIDNIFYRLLIPSILFAVLVFFPSHILRGYEFDLETFCYKTIGGGTFWFTSALVVAEIILLLLLLTRRSSVWFYFICCTIVFAVGQYIVANDFSLFSSYPSFPWQYKHGMYAVLFLALGGVYWKYESVIIKVMNKWTLSVMIILYMVALELNTDSFRVLLSMLDVNIPGVMLSLLSTIILIEVCKLIPEFRFLNYVGQNTIGFYFMSGALPIVLSMVTHKIMPSTNIVGLTIVFLASLGIGFVIVYLINRLTPWLFDLRLLRRK